MNSTPPYRGLLRVFDRPVWRDWIFWLFIGITAASVARNFATGSSEEPVEPVSGVIDAIVTVGVTYVLWAAIPSAIRSRIRRKRSA